MRTFKTIATGVIAGVLLVAGMSASADAQFYKGKTVRHQNIWDA